jgi:hypothetical protein
MKIDTFSSHSLHSWIAHRSSEAQIVQKLLIFYDIAAAAHLMIFVH